MIHQIQSILHHNKGKDKYSTVGIFTRGVSYVSSGTFAS